VGKQSYQCCSARKQGREWWGVGGEVGRVRLGEIEVGARVKIQKIQNTSDTSCDESSAAILILV
jgi:hypothetical protein